MNELFRLELPEKLLKEISLIENQVKQEIERHAHTVNSKGQEVVSNMVRGFLMDKDTPDTDGVQIKGKFLVWYGEFDGNNDSDKAVAEAEDVSGDVAEESAGTLPE